MNIYFYHIGYLNTAEQMRMAEKALEDAGWEDRVEASRKFRMEADGIFLFALQGLRRLMGNHYVFSETEKNRAELQQYREESDSVLSFVKEHCIVLPEGEGSVGSTELFNAYKGYCEECGLKPYSQKSFVQQMMTSFPHLERKIDRIAKRRVLTGIKLGEILM